MATSVIVRFVCDECGATWAEEVNAVDATESFPPGWAEISEKDNDEFLMELCPNCFAALPENHGYDVYTSGGWQ